MAIMPPALIASGHLQTLVARVRHAGGAVSEAILLWLALRQLFASLERLFTAWRNGDLPPLPVSPMPAPHPIAKPARPRRHRPYRAHTSRHRPSHAHKTQAATRTRARFNPTPIHLPTPFAPPTHIAKRRRRTPFAAVQTKAPTHALFITIKQ